MKYIAASFLLLPLPSQADDYCTRATGVDPEFPAGLIGTYDMVGREPFSGKPYTGTVEIEFAEQSYRLKRSIDGEQLTGDAWIEYCGADRTPHLFMKYNTAPDQLEQFCHLGGDGGNSFCITCRTRYAGSSVHVARPDQPLTSCDRKAAASPVYEIQT